MGTSANAECASCGYEEQLALGGGMRNFQTYAAWPVWCDACRRVTTANHLAEPIACERCGSDAVKMASDPAVWRGDGKVTITWNDLKLTDGHYRCPRCDAFTLSFRDGWMLWD